MILRFLVTLFVSTSASGADFSPHFAQFLADNYPGRDFSALASGVDSGFGGKTSDQDTITKRPVVMIHGSTDRAIGGHSGGWTNVIQALLASGYSPAEVYALTWGDGQESSGIRNNHRTDYIDTVRDFVSAVQKYTGTDEVDIIAHSMGVTLARGAILGVRSQGREHSRSLSGSIHTFISIAGANAGVGACLNPFSEFMPTCSKINGFHPESTYLAALNTATAPLAKEIFTIWSTADDVLGKPVFGRQNPVPPEVTCQLDQQTETFSFSGLSHIQVRDETTDLLLRLLSGM